MAAALYTVNAETLQKLWNNTAVTQGSCTAPLSFLQ